MSRISGAWLVVVAGLALSMVSCERQTPGEATVQKSSRSLGTLTGGAVGYATEDQRKKVYDSVAKDSKDAAADDKSGTGTANTVLVSEATLGQSSVPAEKFIGFEAESGRRIASIRDMLTDWIARSATEKASQFDPKPELKTIADRKAALEQALTQTQSTLAARTKAKADLDAQAQAKTDQARKLDEQSIAFKQQADKASDTEALALVEKSAAKKREADALSKAGKLVELQAAQIQPDIDELNLQLGMLKNQIESSDHATTDTNKRFEFATSQATGSREAATKAANVLDKELDELRKLRSGELAQSFTEASGKVDAARKAAKGTNNDPNGQVLIARAAQDLGDLYRTRGAGILAYSDLLSSLAAAKPALPGQAKYAEEAKNVAEEGKKALEDAKTSYTEASEQFGKMRAPGKADLKERLEDVSKRLATVAEKAAEAPGTGSTAPAADVPSAGAIPGDAPDDLKAVVAKYVTSRNTHDMDSVLAMTYADSKGGREFIEAGGGMMRAIFKAGTAFESKFGQKLGTAMQKAQGGQAFAKMLGDEGEVDPAKTSLKMDSESKATLSGENISTPEHFTKVNGKWMIDVSAEASGPQAAMVAKMSAPIADTFSAFEADIQAGKFATADDAIKSLMTQMQTAIMKAMSGGSPAENGGDAAPTK